MVCDLTEGVPMVWKEPPGCLRKGRPLSLSLSPFSRVSLTSEGKESTFPTSDFMTSSRTSQRSFRNCTEGGMFYKVCELWKQNIWNVSWTEFTSTNY